MRYKVDSMSLRDGVLMLEGWCIPSKTDKIEYSVVDKSGTPMKCTAVARDRVDVMQQFGADRMCGFTVAAPFERDRDAWLVMKDGSDVRKVRVNNVIIEKRNSIKAKRWEKLVALVHFETLTVSWDFIKENGLRAFWKKAIHKIQKIDEDYDYAEWQFKTVLSDEEIEAQREAWKKLELEKYPLISIVVPAYNTPEKYMGMLLDSFEAQTYPNFEAIIADGSEPGNTSVAETVKKYAARDPERFKLLLLGGNLGISGNTNAGLKAASGDYIALCDHDDELPPWALFEVVKAIAANPKAQFIYTDEDKIDFDGRALFEPHFKSDLNMEMLTSVNYICHLSVIRRDLLEKTGGFREEFDGAQDHDFFFRCLENATEGKEDPAEDKELSEGSLKKLAEGRYTSETVIHIPVICYHWRYHKGSTASDPKAKLYAFEAGSRAVKAHYDRMGIPYKDVEKGVTFGYYHTTFAKPDAASPLVSIIIPNKDHIDDLDKCIRSIDRLSEYRNIEFVIVENNSTESDTFDYYEKIMKHEGLDPEIAVKVVYWEREFNYSAINNFGVGHASGDYLLFLNNDVELIAPESITQMVNYASRKSTGIVGARLMYGDDTIQHAGVIVGLGGIAGAAFVGLHEKENSYMHRMMCVQDLSAVTAACLMMRKEVFEAVGGFREELAVAFNDIDLCMKVRALGKLVIYDPYVTFHHYESKSRGLEDTPEKVRRFNNEIAVFAHNWGEILEHGDPYYNPNLTLRKANFALRDLTKEKPGEPYKLELDVEKQLSTVLREKQRRGLN
ncbi:MAG: glycosyltransferase family 2 protein [Eubacteriales bacterium]|nr:glycosyltransferase family 2 protein [Eubacteriales bacterium]